ncbi:MAG: flagellar biosynthetic protein FliO [Planctomycetaceae bacterium]|jgi:flagellar biogenesis protein FliO|nr:flagellar biosynthetic protein FliO [Planctomycetaceae bacterium]
MLYFHHAFRKSLSDTILFLICLIVILFASTVCLAQTPSDAEKLGTLFGSGGRTQVSRQPNPLRTQESTPGVQTAEHSRQYPPQSSDVPQTQWREESAQNISQTPQYGIRQTSAVQASVPDGMVMSESQETAATQENAASEAAPVTKADGLLQKSIKRGNHEESEKDSEKAGFLGIKNSSISPMLSMAGCLAVVMGAFFMMVWCMKKAAPRHSGILPREVFEKLGSVPFTSKMQLHLFRLGGKLILASVTPDSMEAVAEITNPDEVVHLVGLCKQNDPSSISASFQQVLKQYAGGEQPAFYSGPAVSPMPQQPMMPQSAAVKQRPIGMVSPAKAYQR